MLQIRLSKGPSADAGGSVKPLPVETVTVACPDHLVLADLPVAKSIGAATSSSLVKTVGRRSRRQLGERVHFCVRCDFPIAIYGRLSPCEHAFCLDCARSDSICYLCDERIQKIQTIKILEGILICAAPHCLKSFLKKTEFESHIHESHADLLLPNAEKEDGKESEVLSAKQPTGSDTTVRGPPRPVISPGSNPQLYDTEEKARRQQPREQLPSRPMMQPKGAPAFGQVQNLPSESQPDNNLPPGFDRPGPHNHFQQGFDRQGTPQPESSQFSDKQQGVLSENQFSEYPPMHSMQPPNFVMPMNSNPMFAPYGVPPFPTDGAQPFYGAPYEMARPSSAPDVGSEQGSLLGFPPGPVGGINYPTGYPQPWNGGQPGAPFEAPPGGHMMGDAFANYQGDYGRNPGGLPMIPPPPSANKGMEAVQGSNSMDPRDGKGILAPQPMQVPPPPPPLPHHMPQLKRGNFHSGDMGRDGQGFGWQHENRDGFGGSQD
ncbi:PREDICTED: E3 ubiquitin-protein ligase Hakai [Theobroma cacao]|uniref:RING-type E3 ubiquitin transferase n=1 Tax=Theobroma cacao TaxID=3641 RepID=A0AB32V381_THECC|nr:PREDICTED: E3 ubiquitin-protein ligase Hakai [Theobroma cacao]